MNTPRPPERITLKSIEYDGKFTVSYTLSDGSKSAFRVLPEVGKRIVTTINLHEKLVAALESEHRGVISDVIGGWDGRFHDKPNCKVCGLLAEAQEKSK